MQLFPMFTVLYMEMKFPTKMKYDLCYWQDDSVAKHQMEMSFLISNQLFSSRRDASKVITSHRKMISPKCQQNMYPSNIYIFPK